MHEKWDALTVVDNSTYSGCRDQLAVNEIGFFTFLIVYDANFLKSLEQERLELIEFEHPLMVNV
jgi:hypothetical protein